MRRLFTVLLFCCFSFGGVLAQAQTAGEKGYVKGVLLQTFSEEIKLQQTLKKYLEDENQKPFQEAMQAFRHGRGGPGGLPAWIKGAKQWYIDNTGINNFMNVASFSSVVPAEGVERYNMVTLFGKNLQGTKSVTFNGVKGSLSIVESTRMQVIAPNVTGKVRIVAWTPQGEAVWNDYLVSKEAPPPDWKPQPTPPPVVEKPTPPAIITKNALGNPEYCFGAIGKGCGGFGDLKEDDKGVSRPGWLAAGCSEETNGKRTCWVAPGSIRHDNCCVKHPSGKHCGGPGKNPFNKNEPDKDWFSGVVNPAAESNHDGTCVSEWDDAFWDVKNGRAWAVDFVVKAPGNLTPAASPGNRYAAGEVIGSVDLCAPNGASISARHNLSFCCSGKGQKYWASGVEDWIICEPASGRMVQGVGGNGKREGTPPPDYDLMIAPDKPEFMAVDTILRRAYMLRSGAPVSKLYDGFDRWLLDRKTNHYQKALSLYKSSQSPVEGFATLSKEVLEKSFAFGNVSGIFDHLWASDKSRKAILAGDCEKRPLIDAYQRIFSRAPNGTGNGGECFTEYYQDAPGVLPPLDKLVRNIKKRHGLSTEMKIVAFEPKEGGVGTQVKLNGENLFSITEVIVGCSVENAKQNDSNCKKISVEKISEKEAHILIPKMNSKAPILFYNPIDGFVTSPGDFTAYPPPVIHAISPKGPRSGEMVELRGENLFHITNIQIAGVMHKLPEKKPAVDEGNLLPLRISQNSNDGEIQVTTKGGVATVALKLNRNPPSISRISPSSALPGVTVSIYGKSLEGVKSVMFGKTEVDVLENPTTDTVRVQIPLVDPGRYDASVQAPYGVVAWENQFEVLESLELRAAREAKENKAMAEKKIAEETARKKAAEELALKKEQEALAKEQQIMARESARKKAEEEKGKQEAIRQQDRKQEEGLSQQDMGREVYPPSIPEEEAVRHEPSSHKEEQRPGCRGGAWSPTLQRCVDDGPQEEAAPPPTCERGSWSPTLRMCVE